MRYEEKTFNFIGSISADIHAAAQILDLNPQLIAGAIAEEHTAQLRRGLIGREVNSWLDIGVATAA